MQKTAIAKMPMTKTQQIKSNNKNRHENVEQMQKCQLKKRQCINVVI
jgi:hypothetical protein